MRRRAQDGAVTAETAMVLPVLIVLAAALSWLVCLGVAQAQVVDAAREAARSLARADPQADALGSARQVAPPGARFSVQHRAGEVEVTVAARVRGPGGIFGFLPGFPAHASAVAALEPEP